MLVRPSLVDLTASSHVSTQSSSTLYEHCHRNDTSHNCQRYCRTDHSVLRGYSASFEGLVSFLLPPEIVLGLPSRRSLVYYGSSLLSLDTRSDIHITHGYCGHHVWYGRTALGRAFRNSTMSLDRSNRRVAPVVTELCWREALSRKIRDHRDHGNDVSQGRRILSRLISLSMQTVGPQLSTVVPCGDLLRSEKGTSPS